MRKKDEGGKETKWETNEGRKEESKILKVPAEGKQEAIGNIILRFPSTHFSREM
jgi:hypothetical protein